MSVLRFLKYRSCVYLGSIGRDLYHLCIKERYAGTSFFDVLMLCNFWDVYLQLPEEVVIRVGTCITYALKKYVL